MNEKKVIEFNQFDQIDIFLINGEKLTATLIGKNSDGYFVSDGDFDFYIPKSSVLYIRKYSPKIEKI